MAGYLSSLAGNFSAYITPRKPVLAKQLPSPPPGDEPFQLFKAREGNDENMDAWLSSTKTINLDELDQSTPLLNKAQQRKRQHPPSTKKSAKRRKKNEDAYDPDHDASDSDDMDGPTLLDTPARPVQARTPPKLSDKAASDRKRMPPPLIPEKIDGAFYHPNPTLVDRDLERKHRIVRLEAEEPELDDDEVFSKQHRVAKSDRREVAYDFDHERARRHADAIELPPDSGYWSIGEKDLFFRLAMRGFEPLVPPNWNIDFKTLPISLFAVEDGDKPIIEPYDTRQFRAIHYLERLFSTGLRVRDRRIMHLRAEPVIKNALKQYMGWAMKDGGVAHAQLPNSLPIHVVKTLRRAEKTQGALDRLTRKLHHLAAQFHDVHGIFPSIEQQYHDADETLTVVGEDDDIRFPVLTGFLICSSVVLVATLDTNPSRFRPLPPPTSAPVDGSTNVPLQSEQEHITKEDSGLRFIATFDFSDSGMDVWNGLAIAIVVMRIRKTLREMLSGAGEGAEMWRRADIEVGMKPDDETDL